MNKKERLYHENALDLEQEIESRKYLIGLTEDEEQIATYEEEIEILEATKEYYKSEVYG